MNGLTLNDESGQCTYHFVIIRIFVPYIRNKLANIHITLVVCAVSFCVSTTSSNQCSLALYIKTGLIPILCLPCCCTKTPNFAEIFSQYLIYIRIHRGCLSFRFCTQRTLPLRLKYNDDSCFQTSHALTVVLTGIIRCCNSALFSGSSFHSTFPKFLKELRIITTFYF